MNNMSVEELKRKIAELTSDEQAQVAAFVFHLRHNADPDYQQTIQRRAEDKNPSHWLSVDEFQKKLDQR